MQLALRRGYAEALRHGADVLVPAGLAQAAARGAPPIPADCRALIDAEYGGDAGPLGELPGGLSALPLAAPAGDARWRGAAAQRLFNHLGEDYKSPYCDDGCHNDHHPSVAAQYLNACVFYASLFGRSPVGAAYPDGQTVVDGMRLPALADPEEAATLQRIAAAVVLKHMGVWWGGDPNRLL
eukprot:Transcript_29405.p6 GENE.Transcript_29405~~Transcript_29405.p6  ORF type:complete len:182 (-),score=63.55 Transcript_29405:3172-3717(-)